MREQEYRREAAVDYAKTWALSRNPGYYNFEKLGGDCTNFASQCLYAGSGVMNHKPTFGWYYYSAENRSPSWTGVVYLYNFLVGNKGAGPFAAVVGKEQAQPGDLVQLGGPSGFYHSPVILATSPEILVAAHTFDALYRPLSSYVFQQARFLHILGVRVP